MAISAAVGVGKKIVGKAIKAAKKKKKKLESKGRAVKDKVRQKFNKEDIEKQIKADKDINEFVDLPFNRAERTAQLNRLNKIPDAIVGAVGATAQKTNKAFKAAKPTVDKVSNKIKKKPLLTGVIAGALGTSVLAATSKVSYTYKSMPDGQIQVNLVGDKTKNTFVSPRHLNPKEIDDVRLNMDMLESIIISENPQARKQEFTNIVSYLNDKYKINQIQGKNLSIMLPRE